MPLDGVLLDLDAGVILSDSLIVSGESNCCVPDSVSLWLSGVFLPGRSIPLACLLVPDCWDSTELGFEGCLDAEPTSDECSIWVKPFGE